MPTFTEGHLEIVFPDGTNAIKFDDENHGLSCMKAVDFIVERNNSYLFIEFKDFQHPNSRNAANDVQGFLDGSIDQDLKYKYRDSFLYRWASEKIDKPIYYYILIAIDTLDEVVLLNRTDAIRRQLPIDGPHSGVWNHKIVDGCAVFNLSTWNKHFPDYPVRRRT